MSAFAESNLIRDLTEITAKLGTFITPGSLRIYGKYLLGSEYKSKKDVDGNIIETDWTIDDITEALIIGHDEEEKQLRSDFLRDFNILGESMGEIYGLSESTRQLLCDERDFLWTLLLEAYSKPDISFSNPFPWYGDNEPYSIMSLLEAARRTILSGCTYVLYEGMSNRGFEEEIPSFDNDAWKVKQLAIIKELGLLDLTSYPEIYEIQQKHTRDCLERMTPGEWEVVAVKVQGFIKDYLSGKLSRSSHQSEKIRSLLDKLIPQA